MVNRRELVSLVVRPHDETSSSLAVGAHPEELFEDSSGQIQAVTVQVDDKEAPSNTSDLSHSTLTFPQSLDVTSVAGLLNGEDSNDSSPTIERSRRMKARVDYTKFL